MRKLLITHWFGPLPPWIDQWRASVATLERYGYDLHFETDEDAFAKRVKRILGATYPRGDGRKVCDYRCAFGALYTDELDGYEFWGTTDLDMVYGRVGHFLPDADLESLDLFSNHPTYVSGPFSLYRNLYPLVNGLFEQHEDWRGILQNPATTGWVETSFSEIVDRMHKRGWINRRYANWQAFTVDELDATYFEGDRLMCAGKEIMVAHFRRTKKWPEGCK